MNIMGLSNFHFKFTVITLNTNVLKKNLLFFTPIVATGLFLIISACKKTEVVAVLPDPVIEIPIKKVFEIDLSKPIWFDEFETEGKPDPAKWGYDLGGNGWGNQEQQNYTNRIENAEVKGGNLIIKAIKETYGGNSYTSARLVNKNKGDLLYGRIEVKALLPVGRGTWPAIWTLPSEQSYGSAYWPDNGEFDIMEHVGFDQNKVHANIHTKAFNHSIGTNKGGNMIVDNSAKTFNVYAANWYPDSLVFQINNKTYFKFTKESYYDWNQWPFDKKFHLLLNVAVGGSWGGQQGIDASVFPQSMLVDYVRIYGIKEKKN
jgi:beta-glucanase (GH16 family)